MNCRQQRSISPSSFLSSLEGSPLRSSSQVSLPPPPSFLTNPRRAHRAPSGSQEWRDDILDILDQAIAIASDSTDEARQVGYGKASQ
mmetsp:Transcript_21980/g.40991  ORF Transcript_21980/g.40991 Transcript_21980/m.40991 type:complete len:87 (+) Transcript_21980:229-489(+)|eukprot:CAMPEP_0178751862 /NCGR_PEP_ID=MMETSP0744-20121128/10749_1 /TAXON_ID=913974 /ORGANISM="Nitzschia punctata, Strain CCMP561" /LENGTH=86 /DNA_ID=CAMNT_0020405529 /DNA_START=155 /DNA_END=415 /DNA_ORIENTATION=+